MNRHAGKVLEFDEIRAKVLQYSFLEETKEIITKLEPLTDGDKIRRELEIVRDGMDLIKFDTGFEIEGIKDIKKYFSKIDMIGAYLEPEELFDIKESLRILRKVKSKIEFLSSKYRNLYNKFREVGTYKGLEELICKIIDEEKNIKDDASLELKDIRNNKQNVNANIRRKFDELINDGVLSQALQERIVTVRDGRFVVPLKADFKAQIKGIEHDRSASGQTLFIEPLNVIPLNNKMRELEVREREEIRKILLRITDVLRGNIEGLKDAAGAVIEVDFLNSKAEFGAANNCSVPKVNEKEYLKLVNARHPLLEPEKVVPVTFEIGKDYNIMLITGPNTGGKTVTMKSAGLISTMALSGIPVPASEESDIGVFTDIYADIGDEQSIEQNLSSFSGHVKNIKEILESVTKNSLVLLDELGSGTDPIEGAAFAMAVIDYLKNKKAKVIISTHYAEVKAYGYNQEGVESASMEFNVETLSPTYRLLMGIPGRSNALTIASKLGMPNEVIERAESYISEEDKKVEKMINNIKEKSDEVDRLKKSVIEQLEQQKKLKSEYEFKIAEIETKKEEAIRDAYSKAEEIVKNSQAKAKALIDKIQNEEIKKDEAKEIQKSLSMLQKSIAEEKMKKHLEAKINKNTEINIKPGEKVYLKTVNQDAVVLRVSQDKNEVQVQAGILKLMVNINDIERLTGKTKPKYVSSGISTSKRVKNEVDLRGMTVDEAFIEIDAYLDSAMMNGYNEVHLIHGKGTGKLRKEIQEYLKNCRYVKGYRDGNVNEGGLGVTVAILKE